MKLTAEEWLEMTGRVDAEWHEMIPVLESFAAYRNTDLINAIKLIKEKTEAAIPDAIGLTQDDLKEIADLAMRFLRMSKAA